MSRVTAAQVDVSYTTELVKPFLHMIGAWPMTSTKASSMIYQKIKRLFAYALFALVVVPCLLMMYLKETTTTKKMILLAPLANSGMQYSKYTILLYRQKEFQWGLNEIRRDWVDAMAEHRQIFFERTKMGRRMMLFVAVTMYGGGVCYRGLLPILKGPVTTPDNITIRPLPCPGYFVIVNEQVSPYYEIIYVLQVIAGVVAYTITSGSCAVCALFVLHACSMMEILENMIQSLGDESDTNDIIVHKKITTIVEYQSKIRAFLNNAQRITEYVCLSETFGGTCVICIVGYRLLVDWQNHNTMAVIVYVILEISFIFSIFIIYYIGQLLVDGSNAVGLTSCTVNWYRLKAKHIRSLVMIVAMSNYPVKLTAGKVIDLSLSTFCDVMKVSLGYLNIIRKFI